MIFFMRHGEDDESRLGGWSDASLSQKGVNQVKTTCESMAGNKLDIQHIFASDLQRAKETAEIVSYYLNLLVTYLEEFRENNNGDLAGIAKDTFQKEYPGMYFASLE